MSYTYIHSRVENSILKITLNRPQKHNALCIDMVKELNHAFVEASKLNDIRAVFLFGNEKAFSAGGDLIEMKELSRQEAEKRSNYVQSTFLLLKQIEVPVIAFISGICFGGGLELAMHCDFCICNASTRMALPEVKYGMIPGAGGTVQLPIHFGNADAAYYLLTGAEIPLDKAYSAGLVQKIIAEKDFENEQALQENYFVNTSKESLVAIKKMLSKNDVKNILNRYSAEAKLFSSLLTNMGHKGIENKFESR